MPTPEEYKKLITDLEDEANLTDEELQQKITAYQGLQQTGEPLDKSAIEKQIPELLASSGVDKLFLMRDFQGDLGRNREKDYSATAKLLPIVQNVLTNFVTNNRRLPDIGELRDAVTGADKNYSAKLNPQEAQDLISNENLVNFLNNQDVKNRILSPLGQRDYSLDVKRIQDILGARGVQVRKEEGAQKFLTEVPEELRKSREEFLAGKEASARDVLANRIAPRVLSELNVAGLAEGPDVGSVLAREAGLLQSTVESSVRKIEQQDAAFFTESAFRIKAAKLDSSEESYRLQIASERERARQDQENRFRTTELKLGSDFELDQLRREQERNLRLKQEGINFDTSMSRSSQTASDIGQVGSSIGQIVGTTLTQPRKSTTVGDTSQPAPTLKEGFRAGG